MKNQVVKKKKKGKEKKKFVVEQIVKQEQESARSDEGRMLRPFWVAFVSSYETERPSFVTLF